MSTKTSTAPLAADAKVWHTDSTDFSTTHHTLPLTKKKPGGLVRYVQLVLGTLYLSLILGCVICFNPALTVMMDITPFTANNSKIPEPGHNYASWSVPLADRRFPFTNLQKSFLLAGTFGACLFLIGPVGISMQYFGAWRTQLAIGFTVSLATGLIPLAASLNFYALLLVRMVLGLSITNLFPVVAAICTAWAPQAERGTFLAILSGYIQLSVIISMPLTGFLCDKLGWPSVFFVHSILGLLLTAAWAFYYRDHPQDHPQISQGELKTIQLGKTTAITQQGRIQPPYGKILSTPAIWAILCAVMGNFLIIQFANTFLPMFLVSAMKFTNSETGILSALPLVLQFLVKWTTGMVTDHLPNVPDIIKVRFCNSVAFGGAAAFFLLATLFSESSRWPIVICLILCIGILGLNSGGFTKSVVLVSAQFSSTTMVGVQSTLCATIFSASFLIPAMTSHGGHFWEYRRVFYLYAGIMIITNLVFVIFGKAAPAKWTEEKMEEKQKKENV